MAIALDSDRLANVGAPKPIEVPATKYRQGGRTMFHVTITLAQLTQLVPKRPDPDEPIEGNRRVDAKRSRAFGYYVLEKDDWVSPAIIVRAPSGEVDFDLEHAFPDGTAWGILRIPLHVLTEILLLDGQHRTLGTFIAIDEINERIRAKRDSLEVARIDENGPVVAEIEASLKKLLATREKLNQEHIAVDIALVSTAQAKQMFVDIANNAKGINRDFTTILDQRDVINRIAAELIENHPLLEDRVELGQSNRRLSPNNPNFIGAKTVADIARAVQVGVSGRVGARIEDELSRNLPEAVTKVETFLDLLVAALPELQDMIDGDLEPGELRTEDLPTPLDDRFGDHAARAGRGVSRPDGETGRRRRSQASQALRARDVLREPCPDDAAGPDRRGRRVLDAHRRIPRRLERAPGQSGADDRAHQEPRHPGTRLLRRAGRQRRTDCRVTRDGDVGDDSAE